MTHKTSTVSVVIPAYNEADRIAKCLEALQKQKTNRAFDVIVVDNASTDGTADAAKKAAGILHLRVIHEGKKGRGAARAAGWAAAQGQIVFSLDADTIVPPDWIESFCTILDATNLLGVGGCARFNDGPRVRRFLLNRLQPFFMFNIRFWLGYDCLNGFSCAIRKWAYDAVGGFDPDVDSQDDMNLSQRLSRLGPIGVTYKTRVTMSARRFSKGILYGLFEYLSNYVDHFWRKKKYVALTDVR